MLPARTLAANRVHEIAVDVTLYPDGSAHVVQIWDGSFDEGTECYFPVTNLDGMTLDGLTVSDGYGAYETLPEWDVDASFAEKAGKCGLVPTGGGYEVCWGISRYGGNRYAVEYRLGGLAGAYDDADGFLFQFVPGGMETFPTDVTVQIQMQDGTPLTEENAAIWAFGFEGRIGFTGEGAMLAHTENPLSGDGSVIVMLWLQKGVLAPVRTVGGSFEEVKDRAFEGSDYGEEDGGGFFVFLLAAVPAAAGLLAWSGGRERRRVKKLGKAVDYFRDPPMAGNLEAAHALARQFYQSDDDGNIIAAALLKLLSRGCLAPVTERDMGFLGREKERISLRLVKPPEFHGATTRALYDLLVPAAGGDGVLQERELESYCRKNYRAMLELVQNAQKDGRTTLADIGCYKSSADGGLSNLTGRGMTQLKNLLGFKKYLLDFSLSAERGVSEAVIWQGYLTFAALLGIGDRVMEQLKKLYPDADARQRQGQAAYYAACRYHHVTYGAAKSAESRARRTAGGGGHASVGGGGGFSGGGHGGGTR